jgi:L-seryl-tRNA(Ser) seleniumtransferase
VSDFARLPKVDRVLDAPVLRDGPWRRELSKRVTHEAIASLRDRIRREGDGKVEIPTPEALAEQIAHRLADWLIPTPRRVLNGTGVLLHTNLGRAVMSQGAIEAMAVAAGACDLEFRLEDGKRGSRFSRLCPFLAHTVGAEDAHVVNNGAAALLLACTALGAPGGVAISRGQMVEIGDGFRVASMAAAGGATLWEVGSTNRTHARDFEAACNGEMPGMEGGISALLWVHLSNFSQDGFVASVELDALSSMARDHGIPLIADLGSGSLGEGLPEAEPTISAYLEAGADLVTCSGDKLLGGPQAGLMAGRADLVERCRRYPMARALRPDKTSLAALHATLAAQAVRGTPNLPLHRMVTTPLEALRTRANDLVDALGWSKECVVESLATIGGGSLPGDTMASVAVTVPLDRPSRVAKRLRLGATPLVGRVQEERLLIDLRSILPEEDGDLREALHALSAGGD